MRNWFVRLIDDGGHGAILFRAAGSARFLRRVRPFGTLRAMDKALDAALVWFRRDLRVADHAALYHALQGGAPGLVRLRLRPRHPRRAAARRPARRVHRRERRRPGRRPGRLGERHGIAGVRLLVAPRRRAPTRSSRLAGELHVQAVYANHDDDPYALARDARARGALADRGVALHTSKDHVVFERSEVLTGSGKPYSVFTPYKTAWLKKLDAFFLKPYPVERHAAALAPRAGRRRRRAADAGARSASSRPTSTRSRSHGGSAAAEALLADFLDRIDDYATARDFPAVKGPSYLGVHLRFGTVSIRRLAGAARARIAEAGRRARGAETWLSELIWRDFYQQVLHHLRTSSARSCKPEFDRVRFEHGRHADERFRRLVRGPHRLSAGRRGDGADQPDRLHAQPAAHGDGELPHQGPRHRLAPRRALLRAAPDRLRAGVEQRRLAVGGVDRLRRAAVVPDLQSGDAEPPLRPARAVHPPLPAAARAASTTRRSMRRGERGPIELEAAGVELGRDYPRPIVDHAEARAKTLQRYGVVKGAAAARRLSVAPALRPPAWPAARCSARSARAGPLPSRACRGSGRRRARSRGRGASAAMREVIMMTGRSRQRASARMLRTRSKPSMRGISMSDSTTVRRLLGQPLERVEAVLGQRHAVAFAHAAGAA